MFCSIFERKSLFRFPEEFFDSISSIENSLQKVDEKSVNFVGWTKNNFLVEQKLLERNSSLDSLVKTTIDSFRRKQISSALIFHPALTETGKV